MTRSLRALILVIIVATGGAVVLAEEPSPSAQPSARSSRATSSESKSGNDKLERKLDQILEHQQAILHKFDDVMEELRVIKIRASQRNG